MLEFELRAVWLQTQERSDGKFMSCISDSELLNVVTVSSLRMSVGRIPEASVGQSRLLKGCSRPQPCPITYPSRVSLYVGTAIMRPCTREPLWGGAGRALFQVQEGEPLASPLR